MKHRVLSLSEQIELFAGLRSGQTQASIAARLGRSAGTIGAELRRNGGRRADTTKATCSSGRATALRSASWWSAPPASPCSATCPKKTPKASGKPSPAGSPPSPWPCAKPSPTIKARKCPSIKSSPPTWACRSSFATSQSLGTRHLRKPKRPHPPLPAQRHRPVHRLPSTTQRLSRNAQRAPPQNPRLEVSRSMLPRTPYIKPSFKLILESTSRESQ